LQLEQHSLLPNFLMLISLLIKPCGRNLRPHLLYFKVRNVFLKSCLGILILHHISYETGRVCSLHNSWYDFAFIEDFMYVFMKLVLYLNHWFDLLIEFRVCSKKNIFCTYLDELTCLRTLQMLYSSWESSVYGIVLRSSKHWVGSVFIYSINHSEIRSQVLERSFGFKY